MCYIHLAEYITCILKELGDDPTAKELIHAADCGLDQFQDTLWRSRDTNAARYYVRRIQEEALPNKPR